ncbi:MAG: HAD-IA family hydrolase [Candidatus Nealsonbacteria bacterium]
MPEENKNKKAIVFGGAGFLGSHVADALTDRGYAVVIFDLKKSPYLKEGQVSITGDINDPKSVGEAMEGCQIVYNFAAVADIKKAKDDPLDTVKTNILGNAVLLEAAKAHHIERFIFASTLYVYSKAGSFYRSSKQACESLIDNYREIYGLNYTILRYGSLYGPRADEGNWIRQILKQAITQGKITRSGDGEEIREYIHIHDAARLSVDILAEEYKNEQVIIAGNQPMRIKDSLLMIKEMLDNKIDLEFLPATSSEHYAVTPFSFCPKLAKRIQGTNYVDFGQGILSLISETYQECANRIKAVIFDFDGTILESMDIKTKAFTVLFNNYPEKINEIVALHTTHGGMSRFEKFEIIHRDILNEPLSEERKQELSRRFSEYVYQGVLAAPFVEGAQEFLEKYHQKIPFFIASGTPDGEIKSLVKERGLARYFKDVLGSPAKKSELILKILKDFNLNNQEVIFVGDAIDDYEGAREAGVKFVWRSRENNPFKELENYV